MTEELLTIINSNIKAAFLVANNLTLATNNLLAKFATDIADLADEVKHQGFLYDGDFEINKRYAGFYFYKPEWEHCSICFSFQEYYKYFRYGIITSDDPYEKPIPIELREKLETLIGLKQKNLWWPILIQMESPYNQNWDKTFEPREAIANGKMKAVIRHKLYEMIDLIGDLKI